MRWILWIVGAALFGVAALAIWWAFTSPGFFVGLAGSLAAGIGGIVVRAAIAGSSPAAAERARNIARRRADYLPNGKERMK